MLDKIMKLVFTLIGSIFFAISLNAKEASTKLLNAGENWYKEDLKFPLKFAREIKFVGDVNLRFPPGWSKSDNPNFWSYVWAWKIEDSDGLNESELKQNIEYYFDGLLGINNKKIKNSERAKQKTNANFVLSKKSKMTSQYVGEVNTIDTRYTKQPMTLFVQVEQYFCEKENKSTLLFRYSPKPYEHSVWKTLSSVELVSVQCKGA